MCRHCKLLKSFLNERKISFTEVDLSQDAELASQIISRTGQRSVPVTEVNGELIVGFQPDLILSKL
jgi:glutaredoxin